MSDNDTLATPPCAVNSHNEWDPLEEVIVGRLEGAMFPAWGRINEHTVPPGDWQRIELAAGGPGRPYPAEMVAAAQRCLDNFIHILEAEGVVVRRPDVVDHARAFTTPDWQTPCGFSAANPRDPFLVIGDEIIEAPMPDRSRYFEAWAYRSLFKEYLKSGCRWTSAPKPQLTEAAYDPDYRMPAKGEPMRYVITEFEPTFDAADVVRCGVDIFVQKSHVTNDLGVLWLRRHLGRRYRIHVIESCNPEAIHIDTTFMPLAPGKVIVSPEYIEVARLPPILAGWDVLVAPEPVPTISDPLRVMSRWGSLNMLMLDEQRVIVEARQEPLISALVDWGFKPIPCHFEAYFPFMGGFHCATLDVRRRGTLQCYF